MRLKTTALITALVMVLIGGSLAVAASTTTQVTNNTYEDTFPQISGDYLVWQGHGNLPDSVFGAADWDIFLYNIVTGVTTQITDNDNDNDLNPRTDGRYIVWWSDKASGAEVWLYDIETGTKAQLSPSDGNNHYLPVIANGRVAWLGFIRDEVILREIWLCDVSGGTPEQLTNNSLDESSPRISDQQLMWVQTDGEGNSTIFVHYFSTGATGPAPDNFIWEDNPQMDGTLRVSMSRDEHDWEIIIRNRDVKGFEQITDNAIDDRYPRISGNNIAWIAGKGDASEIFVALYESDYTPTGNGDDDEGLCFIATAAFGSYVDPHVQVLRDFRDEYLLTNMPGRWFVNIYNTYGPYWADQLNAYPGCKPFVRLALMPAVGMSYFVINTSIVTKLLTGFLLLGFIPFCLLRIHGRIVIIK